VIPAAHADQSRRISFKLSPVSFTILGFPLTALLI
jgi:hypothetical protein